jgi:hypothetical protein
VLPRDRACVSVPLLQGARDVTLPPPIAIRIAEQPRSDAGETYDVVMRLAQPLPAQSRRAFLEAVADALVAQGEQIGPGAVHRIARDLQRQYLTAPTRGPISRFRLKKAAAETPIQSTADFGDAQTACGGDTAAAK